MASPLVTAVMVTGKTAQHRDLALASVRAWQAQTYPNRELLILNDGPTLLGVEIDGVRELQLPRQPSLGHLRNLGLAEARGDWLIQWDDDDWYHPERIAYMMEHRQVDRACLLLWQIRYDFTTDTAFALRYDRPAEGIPGTVLHPRTAARYQEVARHEDSRFLNTAFGPRRIILNNAPDRPGVGPELYLRFYHGDNTWDRRHIMRQHVNWPGRWALTEQQAGYLRQVLEQEYSPRLRKGSLAWPAVSS